MFFSCDVWWLCEIRLFVAGNRVGDVGARALADALKSNVSVTKIDLSG